MSGSVTDLMVEVALESLLDGSDIKIAQLVRTLATRWPSEPALSIAFALTTAASAIEDMVDMSVESPGVVLAAYRLAALVSADVYAIEAMGILPARGHDLLIFWRRVDPYFLRL